MRRAIVRGYVHSGSLAEVVARYLPDAYKVVASGVDEEGDYVLIEGEDVAGWTMDGYVIPRLLSGLYSCKELELS